MQHRFDSLDQASSKNSRDYSSPERVKWNTFMSKLKGIK